MTCYQRHLSWVFDEFEIPYDTDHRKRLDAELKARLSLGAESHCPEVWSALKSLPDAERTSLLAELGSQLQG